MPTNKLELQLQQTQEENQQLKQELKEADKQNLVQLDEIKQFIFN